MASEAPPKETTTVTIRHVPFAVHQGLQSRAQQAHQSMQDYLLDQLARIATRPTMADVLARAEAARRDSRVTTDDLLRFGDEDRER